MKRTKEQTYEFLKRKKRINTLMKGSVNQFLPDIKIEGKQRLMRAVALGLCDVKFYDLQEKKLVDEIESYKDLIIQIRPYIFTNSYVEDEPMYACSNEASKIFRRQLNNLRSFIRKEYSRCQIPFESLEKHYPQFFIEKTKDDSDEFGEIFGEVRWISIDNKGLDKQILKNSFPLVEEAEIDFMLESREEDNIDCYQYDFHYKFGRHPILMPSIYKHIELSNYYIDENLTIQNSKLTKESVLKAAREMVIRQSFEQIEHHYHFDFTYLAYLDYLKFSPAEWMKYFRLNNELPTRVVPVELRKHFTQKMINELIELNQLIIVDWELYDKYIPSKHNSIDINLIYDKLSIEKQLSPIFYMEVKFEKINALVKEKKLTVNDNFFKNESGEFILYCVNKKYAYKLGDDELKLRIINDECIGRMYNLSVDDIINSLDFIDKYSHKISDEVKNIIFTKFYDLNSHKLNFINVSKEEKVPAFMKDVNFILNNVKKQNECGYNQIDICIVGDEKLNLTDSVATLGIYTEKDFQLDGCGYLGFDSGISIDYNIKKLRNGEYGADIKGIVSSDFEFDNHRICHKYLNSILKFEPTEESFNQFKKKDFLFSSNEDKQSVLKSMFRSVKKEFIIKNKESINSSFKEIIKEIEKSYSGKNKSKISSYMRKKAFNSIDDMFCIANLIKNNKITFKAKNNFFIIKHDELENIDKARFHEKIQDKILVKNEKKKSVKI